MLDLYEELKALVGQLNEAKINYALCGGLALALYGIPRATVDIDILIEKESLDQVQALTRGLGYIIKAEPMTFAKGAIEIRRVSKIDPEGGDLLSMDFLLVTPEIRQIWKSRKEAGWEEGKLWVISREGLIRLKSLRGNAQDLDDIQKLKEETDES
jgi:hypothetical protein